MDYYILGALVFYFIAMLGIGIYLFLAEKHEGEKQYFLGNRTMGPWVTAMSAQASDMSGWLLMGFPGSILAFGMGKVWIGIGLCLGTIANWIIVAKRLRRFSEASGDSITLPQYLTNRFASSSNTLKVICAIIFLISFTVYVASSFTAGTAVFVAVIPWFEGREWLAMLIFAAIILVYTFLGGYKAVCWTDFFQGILMLVALLAVPIIMVRVGSFDESYLGAFAEGVKPFGTNPFSASAQDIISGLGWGLGYFGMPHILVRFMGIQKAKMVKKSAIVACVWVVLSLGAAIAIAVLGRKYLFPNGTSLAEMLIPGGDQQLIFITLVKGLFPGLLAGILLAAVIAAAMSTADSQMLVASSAFTSDIYKPIFRKNKAGDQELLWVGRIVVVVVAVVAFFIAKSGFGRTDSWAGNIMSMVENSWGLFGAAFGSVIILSLFWRRFNFAGAIAGIVAGAVVDIGWLLMFTNSIIKTPIANTGIYEIVPGFIASMLAAIIVTLITKKPDEKVNAIFEAATAKEKD